MSNTVPIAGASRRLEGLAQRYPIDFQHAMCVVMPCCAFTFDYEAEDTVPCKNEVYDPPRWTCPICERTYVLGDLGLEELEPDA